MFVTIAAICFWHSQHAAEGLVPDVKFLIWVRPPYGGMRVEAL